MIRNGHHARRPGAGFAPRARMGCVRRPETGSSRRGSSSRRGPPVRRRPARIGPSVHGRQPFRRGLPVRRAGSRPGIFRRKRRMPAALRRLVGRRPGARGAGTAVRHSAGRRTGMRCAGTSAFRRWRDLGFRSGSAWREAHPAAAAEEARAALHDHVNRAFARGGEGENANGKPAGAMPAVIRTYADGFMRGAGFSLPVEPVPLNGTASAVVIAGWNEAALDAVLGQLERLPLREWIVVIPEHATTAREVAERHARSVILPAGEWTGGAAGRALGAARTGADIVLFVDGEQPAPAGELARFLRAVDGGMDAALNARPSGIAKFHRRPPADRLLEFLNFSLGRRDLGVRSLASLPFALSRRAIDTIGAHSLAQPAKAHALLLLRGMRVGLGGSVPRLAMSDPDVRDHLEAWREAMALRGVRLSFPDRRRNRAAAGEPAP